VKRFGRDESIRFVIHMCMEAMLGMSMYSYLYLKLAKMVCLVIAYVFSSTKLEKRAEQFCLEARRGGGEREGVGGTR
jgi:hypothetical protein